MPATNDAPNRIRRRHRAEANELAAMAVQITPVAGDRASIDGAFSGRKPRYVLSTQLSPKPMRPDAALPPT